MHQEMDMAEEALRAGSGARREAKVDDTMRGFVLNMSRKRSKQQIDVYDLSIGK